MTLLLCWRFCFVVRTKFFSSFQVASAQPNQYRALSGGYRILDILPAKSDASNDRQKHLGLIQDRQKHLGLIQDFLRTNSIQLRQTTFESHSNAKEKEKEKEISISTLFRFHREGLHISANLVSHALSLYGSDRASEVGIPIHCLAFVNGLISNIYVGSSLIAFYSKCGATASAYQVFDEMEVKNIVSWTTMIDAFAQESRIDMCLHIYREMRNSDLQPNDFTFTSVLTVCAICGFLGQGRSGHGQIIVTGFFSYVHITNSLISMYAKCGKIEDALCIFGDIEHKDLVSWNSMIAGYAQHGHALQAIELFEEMKKSNEKPDAITFLGVLSSCRHAGIVKQGKSYFTSMAKYGVKPDLDHYSCIVDLLGRAGLIEEARDFIKTMPISPNAITWGSLLSWSRLHGNIWVGNEAAENRLLLEPSCPATHLQLANMYAGIGYWEQAARVRKLMKDNGLKTDPGCSWIEVQNEVIEFRAEDKSKSDMIKILQLMDCLVDHMRTLGQLSMIYEENDFYL